MIAGEWLARAEQALRTAAADRDVGDPARACSTAYHAMFYAARAALIHVGQSERAMGKTHSGVIAAFNQYLARPGLVGAGQGRALSFESNRRLTADYDIDGVSEGEAAEAIGSAGAFVAAVRALIAGPPRE